MPTSIDRAGLPDTRASGTTRCALQGHWCLAAQRPPQPSIGPGTLNEHRQRTVLDLIDQSLERGITGDELAASVGLSKGAFHRAFKATFGVTPFRHLTKRRIESAAALMRDTELSLGAIAVESGFFDQAHLCRQFRKVVGESPRHWRRRQQGQRRGYASG